MVCKKYNTEPVQQTKKDNIRKQRNVVDWGNWGSTNGDPLIRSYNPNSQKLQHKISVVVIAASQILSQSPQKIRWSSLKLGKLRS